MSHDAHDEDDYMAKCLYCSMPNYPEDLCECCRRCIDCISEIGHARTRIVGDEEESYNERG